MRGFFLIVVTLLLTTVAYAQKGTLVGTVKDSFGKPIDMANVAAEGVAGGGTFTAPDGSFKLELPANREVRIVVSHVSYQGIEDYVTLEPNETRVVTYQTAKKSNVLGPVDVTAEETRHLPMRKIDPRIVNQLPTVSGSFEQVLFSQPGVSSNNELSSQYSVRGGNFDENLIYVNGIQIYRPFLVRSGQQEGLSFVNADLVDGVLFSTGGFEARYGDKLSSVLDITYREPEEFSGSIMASLLGGAVSIGDASKNYRFTQIHGVRYRTNQYVLGSLDTDGAYQPTFTDYQGYFTYDLRENLEISFLGNYSRNRYLFIPETRESEFGTINEALRLTVFFQGQEVDQYETFLGALSTDWEPWKDTKLKFTTSAFQTQESETFDILGQYRLDELERDLGDDDFGDVAFNRGVGSFLDHARNYLNAVVLNVSHQGEMRPKRGKWLWGARYQREFVDDELKEWTLLDSAGFSIPRNPPDQIVMSELIKSTNSLQSNRVAGYLQRNLFWVVKDTSEIALTTGIRATYWDVNEQLLFSPRATFSWKPNWYHKRAEAASDTSKVPSRKKADWLFRASVGVYHQPPFYREIRDLFGQLNTNVQAQTSIHYVLGADHNFEAWGRPFKFVGELYYKQLRNMVPYELDNVRIRYYAENTANGYATGADFKINGEFVKNIDSWFSLSILQTREDIENDFYYEYFNSDGEQIVPGFTINNVPTDSVRFEPGFIPRPTDQRVNVGLFFQDYLPKFPTYQMSLNILFGSGLPFGPPSFDRYKDTLRIPPYRRVDIGFSKQLISEKTKFKENNPFRHFNDLWISLEVFNLLQVNNTISYLWVQDVSGRQYAIPNYLTARRVNVKLVARF